MRVQGFEHSAFCRLAVPPPRPPTSFRVSRSDLAVLSVSIASPQSKGCVKVASIALPALRRMLLQLGPKMAADILHTMTKLQSSEKTKMLPRPLWGIQFPRLEAAYFARRPPFSEKFPFPALAPSERIPAVPQGSYMSAEVSCAPCCMCQLDCDASHGHAMAMFDSRRVSSAEVAEYAVH